MGNIRALDKIELSLDKIVTAIRWVYSLFYIAMGVQALLVLAGLSSKPDFRISLQNAAFQNALEATGFIVPILAMTYLLAGGLMIFKRTAPLGIVLLAPFVLVILLTHLMLNGNPVWGIMHAGLLLLFAWQFRSAYSPLWNYK